MGQVCTSQMELPRPMKSHLRSHSHTDNLYAIIDAVTRCRFTVASRMSSPPRNFALEPIFALALQPLPYGVCSCTLCGAAISGPGAVDVPAWFALKAICTTTIGTREIVGTIEIALCCLCGAAISCPVAVEVPLRFALEAICTTTLGTSEIVGTVEYLQSASVQMPCGLVPLQEISPT